MVLLSNKCPLEDFDQSSVNDAIAKPKWFHLFGNSKMSSIDCGKVLTSISEKEKADIIN